MSIGIRPLLFICVYLALTSAKMLARVNSNIIIDFWLGF